MKIDDLETELKDVGWAIRDCPENENLPNILKTIACTLGTPIAGRFRNKLENLQPSSEQQAYPCSLSSQYGLSAFPLHNDTAHLPIPCRYIVMACNEPGKYPAPTILLDTSNFDATDEELSYMHSATFFIRNGKKSFYSTIKSKERSFLRFDPGCMQPVSVDGQKAMNVLCAERNSKKLEYIPWEKNRVAVIDNWRMIHGRGNKQPADPQRQLLRIAVK